MVIWLQVRRMKDIVSEARSYTKTCYKVHVLQLRGVMDTVSEGKNFSSEIVFINVHIQYISGELVNWNKIHCAFTSFP